MNPWIEGAWLSFLVGAVLIVAGRRLVWLAVAAAGFVIGAWTATLLAPRIEDVWIVALVMGVAGAVLAVIVQRLAIAVAGAGLGALIALRWADALTQALGIENQQLGVIIAMILGGLLGLLLASKVFALAAVLVTAAIGAVLVATQLPVSSGMQAAAAVLLVVIGLVVQLGSGTRGKPKRADSD